ncbi:hypothetical protein [Huintestinicola butyrica]|uniref:hypothetical protein n=1 Tax=Huintestinicola butyrica TaxID=2981728 RepID=UPI003F8018C0
MSIKEKLIEFECKHRVVPKIMGAAAACQLAVITASAEDVPSSSSTVDISSVTDTITSNLTSLVGKVGVACAGVVAAGLTIFGLKWAVIKVMSFFKAIGK